MKYFIRLIMFLLLIVVVVLFVKEYLVRKVSYNYDAILSGKSYDEIQSEWTKVTNDMTKDNFRLLEPYVSRWEKDGESLVAIFVNQRVTDYLLYNTMDRTWSGTVEESFTTKSVLSQIATREPPAELFDVGSGTVIHATFTSSGHIVAWTESYETLIFDALTLDQSHCYLIYRLVHGMLW